MSLTNDRAPYRWRDVRVFISSTFRDFHAERDYLVKFVFPELRQWCERYRLHLTDIDLRWGVTAAEAESGKVIDLCLEQIDGSRPFFICMLGNRYGWVPERTDIPPPTLTHYDRLLETGRSGYSITHMEIHHAVFSSLRREDESAVAHDAFFYFRAEDSVPQPEAMAFALKDERDAFKRTFHEQDPALVARLAELKAEVRQHFAPDEVDRRIFCYAPVFDPSLENPEDDTLKGRFTNDSLRGFGTRVLDDLRGSLRLRFRERIAYLNDRQADPTPESELALHERFVETRTRGFIGRTALLRQLKDYVEEDSREILAVLGGVGSGKSSLLAQFYKTYRYDEAGNSRLGDTLLIPHFTGASPGSTALHNLLRRVCEEVKQRFAVEEQIPTETHGLPEAFRNFLEWAHGKVILLIDGLNQLDESGLGWLPSTLPPNVKIIASGLPGETETALRQRTNRSLVVPPLNDEERREIIRKIPSLFAKTMDEEIMTALLGREETRNPLYLKVALEELRIFGGFGQSGEMLEEYVNSFPLDVVDMFVFVVRRLEKDHNRKPGLVRKLCCLIESSRFGLTLSELEELLPEDTDGTHRIILRQMRDYLHNREETIDFFHRALSKAVRKTYGLEGDGKADEWHRKLAAYFADKPVFGDGTTRRKPAARKLAEQPWQQAACALWHEAAETLCDLWFVEAKVRTGMVYDLQEDYERLLSGMPEARKEQEKEEREKERAAFWIRDLIEYARGWNDCRGLSDEASEQTHPPMPPSIHFPKMMPSVVPETIADSAGGVAEPADDSPDVTRLKTFRQFLRVQLGLFVRYGRRAGFVVQQAYNSVAGGPLGSSADHAAAATEGLVCLLNHNELRPEYNSRPAVKRDFLETTQYPPRAVTLTPDARLAIAGGYPVQAWDVDTGAVKVTLKNHSLITHNMAATPDGRFLLLPKDHNCAKLFDLQKGTSVVTYGDDTSESWNNAPLGLTPDGRLAVLADRQKRTCQVLDIRHGRAIRQLDFRPKTGGDFTLAADGRSLACYNKDPERHMSEIYFLSTENGRTTTRISGIPLDIQNMAVTSDMLYAAVSGTPFATPMSRTRIQVYDLRKGILQTEFSGEDTSGIRGLKITEDGRLLFFTTDGDSLKVWDVESEVLVREFVGPAKMQSLAITPDGRWAITGDSDSHLRLWDIALGLQSMSEFLFKKTINDIAVSCTGEQIALAGDDGTIKILARRTGRVDRVIAAHKKGVTQSVFVPGSRLLLSGSRDRWVKLWDSGTGALVHAYRFRDKRIKRAEVLEDGGRHAIGDSQLFTNYLFVTPDGRRAVYNECGLEAFLRTIDLKTGTTTGTVGNIEKDVVGLALSDEGRLLYSAADNKVQVVDLEKRVVLKRLLGHQNSINSLAVTPDGLLAITGSGSNTNDDNSVRTWSVITGTRVAELASFENNVFVVAVSPDGRRIVAGGGGHIAYFPSDSAIRVWDAGSCRLIRTLSGHEHTIHTLRITADAKHVITSSFDDTIRVWDLDTGEQVALFCGGKGWNSDYAVSDLFRDGEFCYWNAAGRLMLLTPHNLRVGPQVATATRLWRYGNPAVPGRWDRRLTTLCLGCGRRFPVEDQVLATIRGILRDSGIELGVSAILKLAPEAWSEDRLLSACPLCGHTIRFNPFFNDARLLPEIFVPRPSGVFKKERIKHHSVDEPTARDQLQHRKRKRGKGRQFPELREL